MDFAEAMRKLQTDPGEPAGKLPAIAQGILRLANPAAAQLMDRMTAWRQAGFTEAEIAEACAKSRETAYSVDYWLEVLRWQRAGDEMTGLCSDIASGEFMARAQRRARCRVMHCEYARRQRARRRR